jgi:hypothetical protein
VYGGSKLYYSDALIYWSLLQDEVAPTCTFKPTSSLEVSTLVLLSRLTQCPFAVKSGGHAAFAGASNIASGITVSLERLNNVNVLPSNIVAVGPGNRWYDVFTALEPRKLAVVGGRASSVGVGGLTLGGGISHHLNLRGFACDNVASFEVVTASGLIVKASPKLYPDLYWALRGGGNNFGIVTNFMLEAFPQGPTWGGSRAHAKTELPAVQKAFVNIAKNAAKDGKAAHYFSIASVQVAPSQFQTFVSSDLQYVQQFPASSPPAILKEYLFIRAIDDKTKNWTLAEATIALNSSQPDGRRQIFWNVAFKLDLGMVDYLCKLFDSSVAGTQPQVSLSFQAISKPALEKMARNGGNALGLKVSEGPYFHILLAPVWDDPNQDKKINKIAEKFFNTAIAEGKKRGLATGYHYLNYASPYQQVIKGYGAANQQRLKSIAKIYDPTAFFQRLQPGGHKLDGAPFGTMVR